MTNDIKELAKKTKNLKLLYVEDDEVVKDSTLKMLNNFFDEIITAEDGIDGIDKFNQHSFDLIITDMQMPRLNGLEMLKRLNTNVPVLVLSAYNYESLVIRYGVKHYMIKPLKAQDYIVALNKIVEDLQ